ncbi:MAG: pyridoxamine 5'-phosphate oxidase family protein [Acidimicrobiia bacterium]
MSELEAMVPADVSVVLRRFLTAELTTVSRSGYPITWPVLASIEEETFRIAIATSIGLPQKALNIRRDPRVSLLYSDSTGSGLADAPIVRVEGLAQAPDIVLTSIGQIEDRSIAAAFERDAIALLRRQPAVGLYTRNRFAERLMDWYFLRLLIVVRPTRVSWQQQGDWQAIDVA